MTKKQQTYENHAPHFVPFYHYFTYPGIALLLAGSVYLAVQGEGQTGLLVALLILVSLLLASIATYGRSFALKAQDRAIRAEENFRHYLLTGKPFDSHLRMRQIIALRFASDEEMPVLARRALAEHMPANEIKKAIKHWRADYNRV